MALEVIAEIRAAENKAQELRRTAAAAARDSIKLAERENSEKRESMTAEAKRDAKARFEAAEKDARASLKALNEKKLKECEELKVRAEKNLSLAAAKCLERIIV